MNYEFKYITHKGNVREKNEDYLFATYDSAMNCGFFIVADGMGGHSYGDYSSKKVCQDLSVWWETHKDQLVNDDYEGIFSKLRQIINETNKEIREFSMAKNAKTGTTLSCLLLIEDYYYIGHVGDSRIYRYYEKHFELMTQDDSKAFNDYSNGLLTKKDYAKVRNASKLTKCIGMLDRVFPQFYYGQITGDVLFLLFSDGFYQYFSDKALKRYSKKAKRNLKKTIREMGHSVLSKDADDNFTGLLIKGEKYG